MSSWLIISALSTAVLLAINVFVTLRPPPHAGLARAFRFSIFSHLLFATGDLATYFTSTPLGYELANTLLYSGLIFVGPAWWLVSLNYAESIGRPFEFGTAWVKRAPIMIGCVLLGLLLTNHWHSLFLTPMPGAKNIYHGLWYFNATLSWGLGFLSTLLYARLFMLCDTTGQRARVMIMIAAGLVVLPSNLIYVFSPVELPFDPTPTALGACGFLYAAGVYRIGHLSLSRLAIGSVLDQQPDGVLVADLDDGLIYWNRAAEDLLFTELGHTPELLSDWLGKRLIPVDKAISTGSTAGIDTGEAITIKALPTAGDPALFTLRDAPERTIAVRRLGIRSWRGKPRATCLLLSDQTQLQARQAETLALQDQIAQAQKLEGLGLLAGGIAHDFNNLLLAIGGNLELARSDVENGLDPTSRINQVELAKNRAAQLTHHLLTYVGHAPSTPKPTDLNIAVTNALSLLQTTLHRKSVQVRTSIEDQLWVTADDVQIEQVLLNLTLNAAEASPGGEISISTGTSRLSRSDLATFLHGREATPGQFGWVEVADSGPGVDVEMINRMFDPFFSTKPDGHGLGLAAVLGIVRKHKGALQVESQPAQQPGTRIRMALPLAISGMPAEESVDPPATATPQATGAGYILVVDDEHVSRDVACRFLRRAGFTVLEADSGAAALALVERQPEPPVLAILDVVMAGLTGPQTLQALRKQMPGLPGLFVSGHPRGHLDNMLEPGVQVDYLAKPFTAEELTRKVRGHLKDYEPA